MSFVIAKVWSCPPLSWIQSIQVIYEISDFPLASAFSFPSKRFLGNLEYIGVIHYFKSLIARGNINISLGYLSFSRKVYKTTYGIIKERTNC